MAVILFRISVSYYKKYIAQRLDPSNVLILNDIPEPDESACHQKILMLGSSRAAHWTQVSIENTCFVNAGIEGQTSAQVALRAEYHIRDIKPDILILQVGTNDIKAISLFPAMQERIMDRYKDNIGSIIKMCEREKCKVVLTTIFPLPKRVPLIRRLVWKDISSKAVDDFNQLLIAMADNKHVFVFDSYDILKDPRSQSLKKEYIEDFLHINQEGYMALNHELKNTIKTLLSY